MRCFVTGATGVIGAHLTRALVDRGWQVAALIRPNSDPWRIADLLPRLTRINDDITDSKTLVDDLKKFRPGVCLHLAWWGVDSANRDDPDQVTHNLYGGLNVYRAAVDAGCSHWIGLGTLDEYGAQEGVLSEKTPLKPTRLYGAVKTALSAVTQHLAATQGMTWCWLRFAPTFGPLDSPTRLIPFVIDSLLRREKPSLTRGAQRWDFLYLTDAADALVRAAEVRLQGDYNVGSGAAPSVRAIAEAIRDRIEPDLPLGLGEAPYRPNQPMHIEADSTRFRAATSWLPRVSLEQGLTQTIAWHRSRAPKHEPQALNSLR